MPTATTTTTAAATEDTAVTMTTAVAITMGTVAGTAVARRPTTGGQTGRKKKQNSNYGESVNASTMDSSLTIRGTKKRKSATLMSKDDLVSYFETKLGRILICSNQGCNCLSVLHNP